MIEDVVKVCDTINKVCKTVDKICETTNKVIDIKEKIPIEFDFSSPIDNLIKNEDTTKEKI